MEGQRVVTEEPSILSQPISFALQFLATYGWLAVGVGGALLYAWSRLRPRLEHYRQQREDAEYHKDPDRVAARLEAVRAARERQQAAAREGSARAAELAQEREQRKREERLRLAAAAQAGAEGRRLGAGGEREGEGGGGYLPLSGGGEGGSTYRAPKRSACSGGGCGR